jgi:hypothetical protein
MRATLAPRRRSGDARRVTRKAPTDPRELWQQADQRAEEAEQLRVEALRIALPAHGWRLLAVADTLGVSNTSLLRVLERWPDLLAEYRSHRPRGRPPSAKES